MLEPGHQNGKRDFTIRWIASDRSGAPRLLLQDRFFPQHPDRVGKDISKHQDRKVATALRCRAFIGRRTLEDHVENNAVVGRVVVVAVKPPFADGSMDLNIAGEQCVADPNAGLADVRSGVGIQHARMFDDDGTTVGCGQRSGAQELAIPESLQEPLVNVPMRHTASPSRDAGGKIGEGTTKC